MFRPLCLFAFSFAVIACGSNGNGGDVTDGSSDAADAQDAFDAQDARDTTPYEETGLWDTYPIDSGPPPTLSIYFDDEDRRSNVGFGDPGILIVQPKTAAHPAPIVDDALPHVHLRTWPELAEVAGGAVAGTTEDGTTLDSPAMPAFHTHVTFHPSATLEDRWYLLSFLDASTDWRVLAPTQPGGEWGMRFRPGSDPRLRSIYLEATAPIAGKVYVYFSEKITASADVTTIVSLTQPGADTACTPMATSVYDDTIGMICTVDAASSLEIAIGAGIAGDAAPHLSVAPLTLDFDHGWQAASYLAP